MVIGLAFAFLVSSSTQSADIKLRFVPTGSIRHVSGYWPLRIELSAVRPIEVKRAPNATDPEYGVLEFGPAGKKIRHAMLFDVSGNVYFDSNGNGDLTDDVGAPWQREPYKGQDGGQYTQYDGAFIVPFEYLGVKHEARLFTYRFDKGDPDKEKFKNTLFYSADYSLRGRHKFGDAYYNILLLDYEGKGDFLNDRLIMFIDRNGDNVFKTGSEQIEPSEPFNVNGTTYEVDRTKIMQGVLTLRTSSANAEDSTKPSKHKVGDKIQTYSIRSLDGTVKVLNRSYMGKIVLIDLWATTNEESVAERKNLADLYKRYHDQGLEIQSNSLDNVGMEAQVRAVAEKFGATWDQMYEAKGMNSWVAKYFIVDKLPFSILVDGDTLKALAVSEALRGPSLDKTVGDALAKKKAGGAGLWR